MEKLLKVALAVILAYGLIYLVNGNYKKPNYTEIRNNQIKHCKIELNKKFNDLLHSENGRGWGNVKDIILEDKNNKLIVTYILKETINLNSLKNYRQTINSSYEDFQEVLNKNSWCPDDYVIVKVDFNLVKNILH